MPAGSVLAVYCLFAANFSARLRNWWVSVSIVRIVPCRRIVFKFSTGVWDSWASGAVSLQACGACCAGTAASHDVRAERRHGVRSAVEVGPRYPVQAMTHVPAFVAPLSLPALPRLVVAAPAACAARAAARVQPVAMDDAELARRSILGFGEMMAALGRGSAGPDAVVRRPNAIGARVVRAAGNPWFDGAVVPPGMAPPADDALLPFCVWTQADAVGGRVEDPDVATPCLGVELESVQIAENLGGVACEEVPLTVLGDVNERAYDDVGVFGPLVQELAGDGRVQSYGLREAGAWVCVAMTLIVGDDLSIHYVATEACHRRRGLASRLVTALMAAARTRGMRTATLQASVDGLPVWTRLGFRPVTTLRGYVRPTS
jgi:GNAT superfamily N-acetyltransferase